LRSQAGGDENAGIENAVPLYQIAGVEIAGLHGKRVTKFSRGGKGKITYGIRNV